MNKSISTRTFRRPPTAGFKVSFSVSSIVHNPDEVTTIVGIQPTKVRFSEDQVRKYHAWTLEADSSLNAIQEQIDHVMTLIRPYAANFNELTECDNCLSVYIYQPEFKLAHPGTHPSFNLSEDQIALLHSMNASFVVD